jgi:hypothetical protein
VFRKVAVTPATRFLLSTRSRTRILCFALPLLASFCLNVSRRGKNPDIATLFLVVARASLVFLTGKGGIITLAGWPLPREHLLVFVATNRVLGIRPRAFWASARTAGVSMAVGRAGQAQI